MKIGFDNDMYLRIQKEKILERIKVLGVDKLYLEFGGKLFDDLHASRVLPGFNADSKIQLLKTLKDDLEVIFCISADDIERNKIRADFGITYEMDMLRLIDNLRAIGIFVSSIVITKFTNQVGAETFANKLRARNENVYVHYYTKGYPTDVDTIVSEEGYGVNPYVKTQRPLVVVTAPGPGSAKLGTCLSQLYHENMNGVNAGYAKFETFPIWDLPLKHPANIAYEAATADLNDKNMIDPFHLETYDIKAVNYNRDVEVFPVVKTILERISGKKCVYNSPTDMGVNTIAKCIIDDDALKEAGKQEIIRRYYKARCDYKLGLVKKEVAERVELLMNELEIKFSDRQVVNAALEKSKEKNCSVVALELPTGEIVTGKTSELMDASSAVVLNAIKSLAGIPDDKHLLLPSVLKPIGRLRKNVLKYSNSVLNLEEVIISLGICAATDKTVEKCVEKLAELKGLDAHSTFIITGINATMFAKLGINLTCEPEFATKNLYYV